MLVVVETGAPLRVFGPVSLDTGTGGMARGIRVEAMGEPWKRAMAAE